MRPRCSAPKPDAGGLEFHRGLTLALEKLREHRRWLKHAPLLARLLEDCAISIAAGRSENQLRRPGDWRAAGLERRLLTETSQELCAALQPRLQAALTVSLPRTLARRCDIDRAYNLAVANAFANLSLDTGDAVMP